jgi:5,10-methylene-tetrahydrofolate dehydrogenase/methenyl tetrahydrofolate cyclohydrolase
VIDVGINRLKDSRLVADVDFEGVAARARRLLLANTVTSCERRLQQMSIPVIKEFAPA